MEQPHNEPFSSNWYDEMWGRIVVAIGAGKGRDELVGILQYVARDRYDAGMEAANKAAGSRTSGVRGSDAAIPRL